MVQVQVQLQVQVQVAHLCTKASALEGGCSWSTQATSGMSTPLAITSVHSSTPDSNDLNLAKIFFLFFFICPWMARTVAWGRREGRSFE